MFEAIDIIKKLFASGIDGKDVKHSGQYYKMESTRLWTMPEVPPEILVATAGPITAKRAGKHADGLITVGAPLEKIEMLFGKFDDGVRESGRDPQGGCPRCCRCTCRGRRRTRRRSRTR